MTEATDTHPKKDRPPKSGQQIGAENVDRLRSYLDRLKSEGAHLPSRQGNPDKSAIALACGFNRQTLYNNPEAIDLLNKAVVEIGLESSVPVENGKAVHLQQQVDKRDRRIQQLEVLLETRTAEVTALRRELIEVKEKLRQYQIMEEVMTTNGRRYRP